MTVRMLCHLIENKIGVSKELTLQLHKNDHSCGVPHDRFNKKHTSNHQNSPHLPHFGDKTVIVWLASHVLPYLSLWVGCRL